MKKKNRKQLLTEDLERQLRELEDKLIDIPPTNEADNYFEKSIKKMNQLLKMLEILKSEGL